MHMYNAWIGVSDVQLQEVEARALGVAREADVAQERDAPTLGSCVGCR